MTVNPPVLTPSDSGIVFPPTDTWYRPTKAIEEFLQDQSFVRVLIGGRGSSKTFGGVCMDLVTHCWNYPGAKCNIVRLTEASQKDSTIDTFWQFFNQLGPLYRESGMLFNSKNGGRTFRLPSRLAVEKLQEAKERLTTRSEIVRWIETEGARLCGTIEMRGIPNVGAAQSKFRGMECSRMVFVEADQMKRSDFNLSFACLRWKGTDPETCDEMGYILDQGIIVDSNPPGPSHWIAEMEREEQQKAPEDRQMRFWHLSTDDNAHNLPPDYIDTQIMLPYANNPAMILRMRMGQYADAYDGKPVFYAYQEGNHAGTNLPWPTGAYLVRSYDQGNPNATIFAAYWVEHGIEYWHDLYEIVLRDSDADRQAQQTLYVTETEFPFWNDRVICSGVLDFCDPAYAATSGTMKIEVNKEKVDMSQLAVFRKNGIYPGFRTHTRGLQETIAVVNRLMQKRDATGRYVYRIDVDGCPKLASALRGGYRFPTTGEPGFGKNEPLKGPLCEGLDSVADASRYGKINCLRLLQAEMNKPKPPLFSDRKKKSVNPARRI